MYLPFTFIPYFPRKLCYYITYFEILIVYVLLYAVMFYLIGHSAPMVFPMAFNLVKHVMDESTRNKIFVLGGKS